MLFFGLLLVIRDIIYSRKRLGAKDEQIEALKTAIQIMKDQNSELREFAKTYGPNEVKDIIKLKEDKAQIEAENAAKELVKKSLAEQAEQMEELKKENSNLSRAIRELEESQSDKKLDEIISPVNESESSYSIPNSINELFLELDANGLFLWGELLVNLGSKPKSVKSVIHSATLTNIQGYLAELAKEGLFSYEAKIIGAPEADSYEICIENIQDGFWTYLAFYIVLDNNDE